MDFFIGFLMVLLAVVCLLLILIILMQRPRQDGLGAAFGSGMTDQMFGAHTTNVLQKATTWLGISLFVLSFTLAVLMAHRDSSKKNLPSLVDEADKKAVPTAPVTPEATAPVIPPTSETPAPVAPAAEAPKVETTPTPAPATPAVEAPKADATPAAPAPAPVTPAAEAPAAPAPAAPSAPAAN